LVCTYVELFRGYGTMMNNNKDLVSLIDMSQNHFKRLMNNKIEYTKSLEDKIKKLQIENRNLKSLLSETHEINFFEKEYDDGS
jgi:hypothetical protein